MTTPVQIRLPLIFDPKEANAWLFKEPEPVLIDCGEKTPACMKALEEGLAKEGLKVSDLKKVIITHAHLDHMGLANWICENSDATIWLPELAYLWAVDLKTVLDRRQKAIQKIISANIKDGNFAFFYGYDNLAPHWDEIPAHRIKTFPMEGSINFGGQDWEILYKPGHCINQTCFFHRESKQLISADMLLAPIAIPIIDASVEPPYEAVPAFKMLLNSYQDLGKMDLGMSYPGHFNIIENSNELVQIQLQKIARRKQQCLDQVKAGNHDFLAIQKGVYKNRVNDATFFMIVGLLNLLQEEGQIRVEIKEGYFKYYE